MRFWLLCAVIFFSCGTPRSVASSPGPVKFFVDPAGKVYLLLTDSRLVTQNKLGQNVNEFFDSSLGAPDVVDVTNPFSILLYYQDFGRLVTLDRTLSEISRKDLFDVEGLRQPGALARANDNQIWVYDSWDYRLKVLDERGRVQRSTNNLRLELGAREDPTAIYVDRGTVALYFDTRNQLAVLTNYGRFEYWIDLPPTQRVDYLTPYLIGYDQRSSWRWVAGAKTVKQYARPQVPGDGEVQRLPIARGYYRLLDSGGVELFETPAGQ